MLRNKEIKQFIMVYSLISVLLILIGLKMSIVTGVLMLSTVIILGILFLSFTRKRYQHISKLSEQIDQVLHNDDTLCIETVDEGELSILQSEISKMVICIHEQNKALKKEKKYLADSLADIAHQLRTPLTSANLMLSVLRNNPKEYKLLLREVEELFRQMDWLITTLLKLSRLDAGMIHFKKDPILISQLMQLAFKPFLISMELHHIEHYINLSDQLTILGDSEWLLEAIRNILKNCIESIGDKGYIEINCEDTLLYTEITIHDSGKGFKKEELPYVFDRFYRGEGSKGYGIGMALCKKIIVEQGGLIRAKNHLQGGAIFMIRFQKSMTE